MIKTIGAVTYGIAVTVGLYVLIKSELIAPEEQTEETVTETKGTMGVQFDEAEETE